MSDRMGSYRRREEQRRRRYEARLSQNKYKKEIEALRRRSREEGYKLRREMYSEMNRISPKDRRFSRHGHEADFDHYYARLKYARPTGIIFILVLWGLLFALGGLSTGLGIVFSIFAALSTLGYVVQIIYFGSIEKRVLKPIQKLKEGMDSIAKGNYEVKVESEGAFEVKSLINDFNGMAKKLKENEDLKAEYEENRKQLIASISHDLKTPITSVLGYIEAVSDAEKLPPEKLEKYLKIIHNNIAYMNRLIDDLFLFSKLDMQKLAFDFAVTQVSPFLSDMMEELKLDLEERQAALTYNDETDGKLYVKIDAKRFYQVVRNITDNACKYGEADKLKIDARLYMRDNKIYIDIANNGPAIPQESLKHIFDRFYRIDTARTKDISSTGLGLAIAKELVEAHGGEISAESAEGRTCFTIALPVSAAKEEEVSHE